MTYQNFDGSNLGGSNLGSNEDSSQEANRISTNLSPRQGNNAPSSWPNRMLGGPKGLLIGLGLGLGLAFIGTQLSSRQPTAEVTPDVTEAQVASASVTTVQTQRTAIQETISANGTVEAVDLLSVSPRASGLQIKTVTVREGDRVSAGQVLAVLDDAVLRAQLQQAQAQVAAAQAQVTQAEATVAQDEAEAAEAQDQYNRYVALFDQGAISEEALVTRRTEFTTAQQSIGSSAAAVDSAKATVRSAQADVDRLRTQLSQTEVLAPASGVIAEKMASVGDTASVGTPLFSLIEGDQLELALTIPQTQLAKITPGASVQITSSADPNLQLQGSVRTIDPVVDAQSRKATVKVNLPGSDRIRSGMFLQAAIVTGSRQGLVVPAAAVLPQSNGNFVVYTLEADGTAKANTVEIGDRTPANGTQPAQVEVTGGLNSSATVIVEGASYIQNGDTVNVVSNAFTS
ncbi:MAG: efflux RND transporter periplasmic adaptor subunit [Cyanobacteria bacterium P01_D01_bin.36]